MENSKIEALYSVKRTADVLGGVSTWTVYAWISKGRLKKTKVGSRTMIRRVRVTAFHPRRPAQGRKVIRRRTGLKNMPGFTKLFATILTSTIWRESPEVCKVWITMLALADQDGVVEASVPGLADMARVSLSEVEAALAKFQSPDPYSRSPENEGRRIEPVKGGWRLVNYDHYRHRLDPDEQNQKHAIRQQRYRQRLKERDAALRTVTQGDGCVTPKDTGYDIAEAEAEPEADADAEADADEKRGYCAEPDGSTPASAVITLPLNDNSEYPIVQQQVSEWSALFRAVNVGQQLRNMKAWLLANPTRRKTNRGIERFIVGWLSREQNNPNFHRSMSDGPAIKESPRTQRNRASLEAVKQRNSERLR